MSAPEGWRTKPSAHSTELRNLFSTAALRFLTGTWQRWNCHIFRLLKRFMPKARLACLSSSYRAVLITLMQAMAIWLSSGQAATTSFIWDKGIKAFKAAMAMISSLSATMTARTPSPSMAGAGADLVVGGQDNETYLVDNIADQVSVDSATGLHTVIASVDFTLSDNIQNLQLTGDAQTGTGNGPGQRPDRQ